MTSSPTSMFDVHATNVTGSGAVQVVRALLDALVDVAATHIGTVWLPDDGALAGYRPARNAVVTRPYRRFLPNAVSRTVECLWWPHQTRPILVLGDVPLATSARQIVLLQTPNLFADRGRALRYRIAQALFRRNMGSVSTVIVQTEEMRRRVMDAFPALAQRTAIVPSPPPAWVSGAGLRRTARNRTGPLHLFYPAAGYPYKNHALLRRYAEANHDPAVVEAITVTEPMPDAPALLHQAGRLDPAAMMATYADADALLFPSLDESFGLPLVEAMFVGLPVVCADRGYARALCGAEAIYFDPLEPAALATALKELKARLDRGWWPVWDDALAKVPSTWNDAARTIITLMG